MNWFTDHIGWRFVCFGHSFNYNRKIVKLFPELKPLINRNCFWRVIKFPYWGIIGLVLLPLWLPWFLMELLRDHVLLPDPYDKAVDAVREVDNLVPRWKRQKAMGLPYEPIYDMDLGDEEK